MTKKHYEMLAHDWGKLLAGASESEFITMERAIWESFEAIQFDNPAFDRERFLITMYRHCNEYKRDYEMGVAS